MKNALFTTAVALAAMPVAASAAVVTSPFLETFDDATTDVTFGFNDFQTQATGTGSNGTGPGWTVQGGQAIFYDNSNFGDVGVASVMIDEVATDAVSFSTSADFDVTSIDFTTSKLGVFSFAQGPLDFTENFVGLYAYVQENDTSGGSYDFNLLLALADRRACCRRAPSLT